MSKYLSTVLIILIATSISIGQTKAQKQDNIYHNTKIHLTTGEVFKVNRVTFRDSIIYLSPQSPLGSKKLPLEKVEMVQTATKNYALVGGLCGTGIGFAAMLITSSILEEPKTDYESDESGWEKTTTTYKMPIILKVLIVGVGTTAGSIAGYFIKGGYEQIYPSKEIKKISFDVNFRNKFTVPMLSVYIRF